MVLYVQASRKAEQRLCYAVSLCAGYRKEPPASTGAERRAFVPSRLCLPALNTTLASVLLFQRFRELRRSGYEPCFHHVQGYGVYTQRNLGSHICVCMININILLSGYCTGGCDAYFFQHIPRQILNRRETRAPWLVAGLALLTRRRGYSRSYGLRWLGLVMMETTRWLQFYHSCKYVPVYGMFVLLMHLLAKAAGSRPAGSCQYPG